MRNLGHFGIARHLQHGHRVHETHDQAAVGLFTDNDVAGQQEADLGFVPQHTVRERLKRVRASLMTTPGAVAAPNTQG